MSVRESFDCLWCGTPWTVRSPDDIEGWAQLCPDCLSRAGENPFLRTRLRAALEERGASRESDPGSVAVVEARPAVDDDWYLRRGAHEHGPVHDAAWAAELDAAGRWLDGLPMSGRIVELAAGVGWWSPLLASKGELWLFDDDAAALERARDRLLAHGLRAHLHVRDPWAEPDGPADGVFVATWLSRLPAARVPEFLALAARWLRPGGRLAVIDALDAGPPDVLDRLRDGLELGGFREPAITSTGRFFVLGTGIAEPASTGDVAILRRP
jgi:hypothetical protein